MSLPILSILLIVSLIASFSFIFNKSATQKSIQRQALFFAFIISALCLSATFVFFQSPETGLQLIESYNWIGNILVFKLGLDGLSVNMLILIGFILPIIVASQKITISKLNYGLLFAFISSVLGVFIAQDLISFFILFELEIIPLYIFLNSDNSIGSSQSQSEKNSVANQFLIYALTAASFILAGIIILFMANDGKTFSFDELSALNLQSASNNSQSLQKISFFLFLIGFLIKIPVLPFHAWFVKAIQRSSLGLIALLMIKVSAYALLRFTTELFPALLQEYSGLIAFIGCFNIIVGALFAIKQKEIKLIIAYSVISHLGFVLLGLSSGNAAGLSGALFQIFSHTILSIALILALGILEEKAGKNNLELNDLGGLANNMPIFFFIFMGLIMANLGLPALSGFIGESLVFYSLFTNASAFNYPQILSLIATLSIIFSAAYLLYILKKTCFGSLNNKLNLITDLENKQKLLLGSLLFISLFLGIFPQILLEKSKASLELVEINLRKTSIQ